MIAMQSVTGAALGAALPVAAAAASAAGATAPAGQISADQAFDEVFRQLTGGLLMTAAGEGIAAAVADETTGAVAVAAAPDVETAANTAVTGIVVPVLPVLAALPVEVTPEAGAPDGVVADGQGRDLVMETAVASTAGSSRHITAQAAAARAPGTAASPQVFADAVATSTASAGDVVATPNAPAVPVAAPTGAGPGVTASVAATPNPSSAPSAETDAEITAAATPAPAVSHAPVPDRATSPVAIETAATPAATQTPPTEVEVDVRGLDRRRGMRETPARARTFADTAETAPAPDAAPAPVAPPVVAETAPSAATAVVPPIMTPQPTAAAERVFALQRALAGQTDGAPRQAAPDATAATTTVAAAVVAALSENASGQDAGGRANDQTSGRRQGRAWQGAIAAAAAAIVPQAARVASDAEAASTAASAAIVPGPAAGAAWRAALAASAAAEALGPIAEPGTASLRLPVVTAAPAFELPALRQREPIVVETPVSLPELDAATGEAVHTQIVKSLRLQWHGGVGEARVTLKPGYLGEVVASVKVDQGVVTATLHADTPEVRRWMETHSATLRDALVDHGLKLDRLTVAEPERQTAPGDKQSRSRQQQQEAPRQRARRETAETDIPFEVITE